MIVDRVEQLLPTSSPWLEALLAYERTIVPQTSGMRARALGRARALMEGVQAVPLPQPSWFAWHRTVFGSAAGLGLLTTAAILHLAGSPSTSAPEIDRSPAALNTRFATPPAQVSEPQPEWAEGVAAPLVPANDRHAGEPETRDLSLNELDMLERARRLDARGQFLAVLAIAAEHERLHPAGHLCEERDVLRLRALIALKRGAEANQAVRNFHHDYPRSVLLPTVDEMLAASQ